MEDQSASAVCIDILRLRFNPSMPGVLRRKKLTGRAGPFPSLIEFTGLSRISARPPASDGSLQTYVNTRSVH